MKTKTERIIMADRDWVRLSQFELEGLGARQVRIETQYSYLSAGTELNLIRNARQAGGLEGRERPLGYSLAGVVSAVGDEVTTVAVGDRVCAIGTGANHSRIVHVPESLVTRLPDAIATKDAAPMAMLCFAFEGVRKASLIFGENVLVLGGGMMGQISAQLAAASGTRVLLVDVNTFRLKLAQPYAETLELNDGVWDEIRRRTAPVGVEAVFLCFGGDATETFYKLRPCMMQSPERIPHGRLIASGGVKITLTMADGCGNLRFISSAKAGPGYRDPAYEAGHSYPSGYVPWTVQRNVEVLLAAIARGALSVKPLITHVQPFSKANAGYDLLMQPQPDAMALVFDYSE